MTISDLILSLRSQADDETKPYRYADAKYQRWILGAMADLEGWMGKIVQRVTRFDFSPVRDANGALLYEEDGVTPHIDRSHFHVPDPDDGHGPIAAIVNGSLTCRAGAGTATLESAGVADDLGVPVLEEDVIFVRISSKTTGSPSFDVSLDGRESWIEADFGKTLTLGQYIDVSDLVSSRPIIKWTVPEGLAVHETLFERWFVPRSKLRYYAHDIEILANARRLEFLLEQGVQKGWDPITIQSIQHQIYLARSRYGFGKTTARAGARGVTGQAIEYYPKNKAQEAIFGSVAADGRIVGITSDGEVRRAGG